MSSDAVSPFEPTLVGAIRRHWRLVLGAVLALAIPAAGYVATKPTVYTAKASLLVADPRGPGVLGGQDAVDPERYVADQLAVFTSATLASTASNRGRALRPRLDRSPSWFLAHMSAGASAKDNNVISVAVTGGSASEAMQAARAVVSAYSDVVKKGVATAADAVKAQLDTSIASIDESLAALTPNAGDPNADARIQQLTDNRSPLDARRRLVAGEALHPSDGVSLVLLPNDAQSSGVSAAARVLLLAIVLGSIIGGALAYLRSYRHRVFSHSSDPEILLGAPLLVDVSRLPVVDIFGRASPKERDVSLLTEMFGIVASFIADARSRQESGISIALVSGDGGAACTAIAWRTALALSSQGLKVLLVDADGSWQPTPRWLQGAAAQVEWVEQWDGAVDLVDLEWTSERPVCFSGKPPEVRFPHSQSEVLREVESRCDVVLIVTPRFLESSTAATLAAAAGRTIVVAHDGGSVTNAQELARRLQLTDAHALGYVYCGRQNFVERAQPAPDVKERSGPQVVVAEEVREPAPVIASAAPARWPNGPRVVPPETKVDEERKEAPVASSPPARWPKSPRTKTPAAKPDEERKDAPVVSTTSARWPSRPRSAPS